MLINSIILAISSSIDSLGIGITYGIKNMEISFLSKLILFIISLVISFISIFLGDLLNNYLTNNLISYIGSGILIFIGFSVIIKSLFEHKNEKNNYYDFNYSNLIDPKEAVFLGLSLSLDSFGIGVSYSLIENNYFLFPFFISIFQIIFLSTGNMLGKKIKNISNLPDFLYGLISGILLIFIGFLKL